MTKFTLRALRENVFETVSRATIVVCIYVDSYMYISLYLTHDA